MNLAENLNRPEREPRRLEINHTNTIRGNRANTLIYDEPITGSLYIDDTNIGVTTLSASSITLEPIRTNLTEEAIDQIARRVLDLIREEMNNEPRRQN